jgi:Mg2+-importing ATPase
LAAVVIVVTRVSEPRDFLRLVERAQPWWIAVAFVLQAATYVALASVWRGVAFAARQPLGFGRAVRIALAKLFVDQTLPSGGISGGVLLVSALERCHIARPVVIATAVVDVASYYLAYGLGLAVALAIAAAEGHAGSVVIVPAVIFIAVAAGIGFGAIALARAKRLPRLPGLRRAERWLVGADRQLTGDARLLARAIGWQLAIVVLDGMTTWTLLRSIGIHVPVAGVFASFMIASLARTLSITPAGLGVFEGVGVLTLHQIGVPHAAALSATLLFRGLSYWLPMIPGFIASRNVR